MEEGSFTDSPARTGGGGSLEIKPLPGARAHGGSGGAAAGGQPAPPLNELR